MIFSSKEVLVAFSIISVYILVASVSYGYFYNRSLILEPTKDSAIWTPRDYAQHSSFGSALIWPLSIPASLSEDYFSDKSKEHKNGR